MTRSDLTLLAERAAQTQSVPDLAWQCLRAAASDDIVARNVRAWDGWRLVPRAFRTRGEADLRTTLFGVGLAAPVLAAPVALGELGRRGTVRAIAKGTAAAGTTLVLSASSRHLSGAVRAEQERYFAQVYITEDRGLLRETVSGLAEQGVAAVFVTVDHLGIGHQQPFRTRARELVADADRPALGTIAAQVRLEDIALVREASGLPVVAKGVLHPVDAVDAVDAGAAGVVVSNHGGRQVSNSVASADRLAEVADALAGRAVVLADSGIRSAGDVAVALGLGADAVLIGRPIVEAAWTAGDEAVEAYLRSVTEELGGTLTLAGIATAASIDRSYLVRDEGWAGAAGEHAAAKGALR